MKHVLLLAVCLPMFSLCLMAQKKADYDERAGEVQKEVWGNAPKQFAVTAVPDSMKDESAVIIATSFDVLNVVKGALAIDKQMYFQTTFHERVKIGDKSALDKYSTLEYEKQIDRSFRGFFMRTRNTTNRYVGATIVKPSGKEIVVNTDEEVLTKNEARYKAGKLAISDLQVGDIIDYYIRIEQNKQAAYSDQGPYSFFLGGEYPVMYQSIHLVLDDKSTINYISANGAPLFKESNDDDNIVLSLGISNIPKRETSFWSSAYRQYPYISIKYSWIDRTSARATHTERGVINHSNISDDLVEDYKRSIGQYVHSFTPKMLKENFGISDIVSNAFGSDKKAENAPKDSFLHVFQNAWRYYAFSEFVKKHIDNVDELTYYSANSQVSAMIASCILRSYDIDHEICLVPSRFSPSKKDILDGSDFEAILQLHTDKGVAWMGFDDIPLIYNEIPARLQGEDAITLKPRGSIYKNDFDMGSIKLPGTPASDNTVTETISASLKPSEMGTLIIDRTSVETGAMRHSDQRDMLLTQGVDSALAASVNKQNLVDQLGDKRKTNKLSQEFDAAFAQVKAGQKKSFEDEIKNQYDQSPKELTSYAVASDGLLTNPFSFKESFTMDNYVKKAGNNYIIEAGKLMGTVTTVDEKDRDRKIDVYMPCARTFAYHISLAIPPGYGVKGLENFNTNISNVTGDLQTSAKMDGTAVVITISRTYNHTIEPVANWSKMLEIIDGFYNVYNQKLLLEKKS